MRRAVLAVGVIVLSLAAAKADDLATIQALNDRLAASFNGGDGVRIAAMYTDDALLMPPGGKLAKGRDDIAKYWNTAARTVTDSKLTAVTAKVVGDTDAQEAGSFTARTRGAHPRDTAGKFVILWRKVGDDWQVAADIWNTNN
jgi:uncharacterized protein (TIGR02246 family)